VIVPCCNEQDVIEACYRRIRKVLADNRLSDGEILRQVIDVFNGLGETNEYVRGLISWAGFRQSPFDYHREPRLRGRTKDPLLKMLRFASTGIVHFTKKSLVAVVTLGMLSVLVGLGLGLRVLWAVLFEPLRVVPGWASTIIVMIFFGGVQLLSIGVIGRYVACVFDQVKKRPEYVIDARINV